MNLIAYLNSGLSAVTIAISSSFGLKSAAKTDDRHAIPNY